MDIFSLAFTINDIRSAAAKLLDEVSDQRIFLFYGEMGAGKTTFIKALCKQLGVKGSVTSPTFAIVNEYASKQRKLFHFDFYRLKNETEALDMGYEEYFYSGDYCFIEWPEKIPGLLPLNYAKIHLEVIDSTTRQLTLNMI